MSTERSVSQRLGDRYETLTASDLADGERDRVSDLVVDVLACVFAGLDEQKARRVRDHVTASGGNAEATVLGCDRQVPAAEAAFANAVTAHVLTYDDRHRASSTHPGSIVIPTALAVGESADASGSKVLTAIYAGYEVIGHLGSLSMGFNTDLPRRPTPVFGPLGAAVTAGMIYDLSADGLADAIGYGANLGGGLSQVWADGTDEYALQNGMAARQGVQAAQFARSGLSAAPGALDGDYGFFKAFFGEIPDELEAVPDRIGDADELDDVYGKPIPACGMVVVPVNLADRLRGKLDSRDATHEDLTALKVTVSSRTANIPGCSYTGPFDTPTRALMSIPFGVAATLTHDGYDWSLWADHHDDEAVQDLVEIITLDYDDTFPKYRTEITAHIDDETVCLSADEPNPFMPANIAEKFDTHAQGVVDDPGAVRKSLSNIATAKNLAPIMASLAP